MLRANQPGSRQPLGNHSGSGRHIPPPSGLLRRCQGQIHVHRQAQTEEQYDPLSEWYAVLVKAVLDRETMDRADEASSRGGVDASSARSIVSRSRTAFTRTAYHSDSGSYCSSV